MTTSSETQPVGRRDDQPLDNLERQTARRLDLRTRHARDLARLMAQRDDLKGVHALADLVDDSLRWSA